MTSYNNSIISKSWHMNSYDSQVSTQKTKFYLVIILMILPAALCLFYIKTYGVNVVYWDQWEIVPLFDKLHTGHLSFSDLFAQQNEHRILFPRLVMLLLGIITNYNTLAEMYFSFFLICLTGLILFLVYTKIFGRTDTSLLKFVPVIWILFSLRQWENLLWGFQIQFFMVILFFVLAIYLLRASQRPGWCFILSIVSGIVCSFSMANGLLIWPIGLLQLFFSARQTKGVPKRSYLKTAVIWCIAGLCVYMAYFISYNKPGYTMSFFNFLQHPVSSAKFLFALLGSPFAFDLYTAIGMGILLALLYIWITGLSVVRVFKCGPTNPFLLSIEIFAFSSVALLLLGRSGWTTEQALVSRYTSITALGVIGLYLVLLLSNFQHEKVKTFILGGIIAIIILGIIGTNLRAITEGQALRYTRKMDTYYLSSYQVQSDKMLAPLYPNPQIVKARVGVLEEYKLNVFHGSLLMPQNLSWVKSLTLYDLYSINDRKIDQPSMPFIIDSKLEDTIIITGWAVDSNVKKAAGGLFINVDGQMDLPSLYGIDRKDVSNYYHESNYRYTGFYASFATSGLNKGQHVLSLKIVTADMKGYYQPDQTYVVEVK
jgi:hypothetical protein